MCTSPEGVLLVLEHLPGDADPPITPALITQLLELNDLQADMADGPHEPWQELMQQPLVEGLEGYCEHGSLREFSDESRALLERIRSVGHALDGNALPASDLVHYDFHPANVLAVQGRVTGIVDWDAVRPGDRLLDIAMLTFTCSWRAQAPAMELLWSALLAQGDAQRRSVAMHHTVLRLVDWYIRHNSPREARRVIDVADDALRRLDEDG
jgi:thiamine kinase-like enzyme